MILFKPSDFNGFDHISSHNGWFTHQIWHDDILFRIFFRFADFLRIFSRFFWIFLKSSDFNTSYHILLENWWYTFWIWYDYFLFQNLSGFFRIFSGLFQVFRFHFFIIFSRLIMWLVIISFKIDIHHKCYVFFQFFFRFNLNISH